MALRKSWLIQRLDQPHGFGSQFSFGGGLKHGGLSDEAFDILSGIFSFHYMGSAEFEFGAIPRAFQQIAKTASAGNLVSFPIDVPLDDVPKHWREKSAKVDKYAGQFTPVYVLCDAAVQDDVLKRVLDLSRGDYSQKDWTGFTEALRPAEDDHNDTGGWLELDNGFLFFTDKDMFDKTAELFGVGVKA